MQIPAIASTSQASRVYQSMAATQDNRAGTAAQAASFADVVSISSAGRAQLAADSNSSSSSSVSLDTNKGQVALSLDAYFSSKPASQGAELPPLLMPSQRNIDALTEHINQKFPAFLSENGIPAAPASIHYDAYGQAQFPADYPYAAQLKQALQDNPGMERELSTVTALNEFKNALDESQPFQQEYAAASSQAAIDKVIAKYAQLFSNDQQSSSSMLIFDDSGQMRIASTTKMAT
ncbi:hypothetical protein [Aquitalea magnusonii]|jgi:hypothetical protein|nr:hypothetical protein [Aquitalea magnusonii]